MPATTSTSRPSKPIERSLSNPIPKKRRVVKRRGRGKGEFESDDEIEREVRTDSETDDDNSSIDSDSESEFSSSELHADAEVVTPNTNQSPPPVAHVPAKGTPGSHNGIFADATNWAEMVAGEAENGAADLPVIDFADMDLSHIESHAPSPAPRPHKSHKSGKKAAARANSAPPPPPAAPAQLQQEVAEEHETEEPVASTSHASPRSPFTARPHGQTARQAYQQRLETDPSFVPKVGEFWGHDDRLLDKDLRSLSGWWRGRWQSRGRGRGAFSMRGRGRGFYPGAAVPHADESAGQEEVADVPPVERQWTHDGFEEMKKRDERRRAIQEQQQQAHTGTRGFGFRGRGFVPARGRGFFVRGGRISPTPTPHLPSVPMGDRVWYTQKPDKMWTKQHDIFLYSDVATKPRPGIGQGVRVKLPGGKSSVLVRLPPRSTARLAEKTDDTPQGSADTDKVITVRIPTALGKAKTSEPPVMVENELATTVGELSIEEVFTVRPNAVPNRRIDLSLAGADQIDEPSPPAVASTASQEVRAVSEEARPSIEQLNVLPMTSEQSPPSAQIQETILRNPLTEDSGVRQVATQESQPAPPALHPLQTSFSPVPPPTSPPYGSPYAYAPALPPGVAVNTQGMPYDYTIGRPVYMQPTPPSMYTPRPMMHGHHPSLSVPFVPSHLRHHSGASPDFLSHPHTPQTPPIASFIDPATGVPIFSPARQTSRIEIRAPSDGVDGNRLVRPTHQRSNLSMSVAFSPASADVPAFVPQQQSVLGGNAGQQGTPELAPQHPQTPPVEASPAYAPYPHQYYYADQYGYQPYVDMSQHVMHYEMYPTDPAHPAQPHHQHHPSQPIVYY